MALLKDRIEQLRIAHMLLKVCFLLIASPHIASPHTRPQSISRLSFYTIEKAVLPIDNTKHNIKDLSNLDELFDKDMFDKVLESATPLRNQIHHIVKDNIKKAQEKQQNDYDLRHLQSNDIKVGDKVLLRNNKGNDRKGGKFTLKPSRHLPAQS